MRVVVIGMGGIGSWLAPPLARLLNYSHPDSTLVIIDEDGYEPDNLSRQNGRAFSKKAEVAVARIRGEGFNNLTVHPRVDILDHETAYIHLENRDIVLLCVDNDPTRAIVSNHVQQFEEVMLISGGNDEKTSGMIQIHVRQEGRELTLPLANEFHPAIRAGDRPIRDIIGCQQAAEQNPQRLTTNHLVATVMLMELDKLLRGIIPTYDEIYVNTGDATDEPAIRAVRRRKS